MIKYIALFLLLVGCSSTQYNYPFIESNPEAILVGDDSVKTIWTFDHFVETDSGTVMTNSEYPGYLTIFKINFTTVVFNSKTKELTLSGIVRNNECSDNFWHIDVFLLKYKKVLAGQVTNKNGEFEFKLKVESIKNIEVKFSSVGFNTKIYSLEKLLAL